MTDLCTLKTFLIWCTAINVLFLLLGVLTAALAGDWIYRMHGRWFAMPRDSFNRAFYVVLGVYKALVLVFNVVPLIALYLIE